MKVLVTGGAGFIGTNLTEYFYKKGFEITLFDNFSRKTARKNRAHIKQNLPDVKIISGDIRNYKAVKDTVNKNDFIIHCAAQVAVTASMLNPVEDKEINIDGTLNILEAARKSDKKPPIIYFSTNKVYGDNINKIPLEESEMRYDFTGEFKGKGIPETFSTDASEHTPYGTSKYTAELYVRDYSKIFGLKTVSNRCSCMYGEHQYGNEDQGWVAHFIISSVLGKPITVYGDGKQVRDVLYVDDVSKLVLKQIEKIYEISGEVFNIGGGPTNTLSLLELLSELKQKQQLPKISYSEWRPADQKVFYCDISKVKKLLGWKPTINTKDGIDKLYEWIKKAV